MEICFMDKSYEVLKELEELTKTIYPKKECSYFTHYNDLLEGIKKDHPKVVVIDLDNAYGIITAKKIKEEDKKIKIIALASNDDLAYEAMANGFVGFLKKPINKDDFEKLIKGQGVKKI